jgi:staphylococcal nuclease domain-containing protein 1
MWVEYDGAAVEKPAEVAEEVTSNGAEKTEYFDVIVSDVRAKEDLTFSVQKLNTEGKRLLAPSISPA